MAYNPYYPGYQPNYYQPPMSDQLTQLRQGQYQQPMQQPTPPAQPMQHPNASAGIIWVQGEEGAKGYLVAPGESRLLMDSENSTFYIKATDNTGMPQPLRIFDYTERTAAQKQPVQSPSMDFVTRAEFDALAARLDALTAPKSNNKKSAQKEDVTNE